MVQAREGRLRVGTGGAAASAVTVAAEAPEVVVVWSLRELGSGEGSAVGDPWDMVCKREIKRVLG